jgi:salicylate hydroxylase
MTMPLTGDYVRRFGRPYLVVHRGELHRLLVQACRDCERVTLRSGVEITGYGQRDGAVRVGCRDGDTIMGDALIGADGIRSAVRAQLVGDGAPRVVGITVYRSIIPMDQVPPELRSNTVTWWTGPGCHFVHYPIAGGEYLNLAPSSETGVSSAFSGVPVPAGEVLGELAALGGTARRLLELGREWRAWALVDREPVDRWCEGRVALLGDAAHPMLHYVAQGACQALEDAVVLGDRLAANPGDITRAFAEYTAARRERTAAMQRISLDSIRLWHARGTRARARNAGLASLSAQDMFDEIAWMHGYRSPASRLAAESRAS